MKATILLLFGLAIATTYATIISTKPERKLADAEFLKRQELVLNLFLGLGHTENFHNEYTEFDFNANIGHFEKPEVVTDFLEAVDDGLLPLEGIFTLYCRHTRKDTIKLFDLFFFAKDFDTFYRAASWARKRVHPVQFAYAYTLALFHREDCHPFTIPPLYEVFPNFFVPMDAMHQLYDAKMLGIKERKITYNNTGYEYNYHDNMYGGPIDVDAVGHIDYKISYFREDVGVNAWYAMSHMRYPTWMDNLKYHGAHWYKRGESIYYKYQQIFARYLLERLANGLPYVETLYWDEPIKVGYNPRVGRVNGESFYIRPDNIIPKEFNRPDVIKVKILEKRLLDAIDNGAIWEITNKTLLSLQNEDGIDLLGKIIFGVHDRPNKHYFKSYFWKAVETIGYLVSTSNDHEYIGGATTTPTTAMRDPVFYEFLSRLMKLFQIQKKYLPRYTKTDLGFPGVKVKDFEVDKLLTYFDMYDYEITNAVPVKEQSDYNNYRYYARQFRLNHKPFNYKITINSDVSHDAFVRIYIGPKYDSEERELSIGQSRLAYMEIDRFPVKLVTGENVLERNSKESPIFTSDPEGLRSLYDRVDKALKNNEPYYYTERHNCGVPQRFQLPRGWKGGQHFIMAVIVTPHDHVQVENEKEFYAPCGTSKLFDKKPFGFPFDRPVDHDDLHHVPNIFFKDVMIYHKDESDVNRSQK